MAEHFGLGGSGLNPLSSMMDSMDMLKRAWSSFNLPSSLAPTLDPEELEQRIKDLKTVEQWLTVNLGMLQTTIQGLEAQRGALVAMQAFGNAMNPGAAASASGREGAGGDRKAAARDDGEAAGTAASAAEALASAASAINPTAWWQMLREQFEHVANAAIGATAGAGDAQAAGTKAAGAPGAAQPKRERKAASKGSAGRTSSSRKRAPGD